MAPYQKELSKNVFHSTLTEIFVSGHKGSWLAVSLKEPKELQEFFLSQSNKDIARCMWYTSEHDSKAFPLCLVQLIDLSASTLLYGRFYTCRIVYVSSDMISVNKPLTCWLRQDQAQHNSCLDMSVFACILLFWWCHCFMCLSVCVLLSFSAECCLSFLWHEEF